MSNSVTVCLPRKINVSYCLAWWVRSHLTKVVDVFYGAIPVHVVSHAFNLQPLILQPWALNERRRLGRKGQMNLQYLCYPAKQSQKTCSKHAIYHIPSVLKPRGKSSVQKQKVYLRCFSQPCNFSKVNPPPLAKTKNHYKQKNSSVPGNLNQGK